jgi:hypothetical protein
MRQPLEGIDGLECPGCGARLGPASVSGEYLCGRCGERSRRDFVATGIGPTAAEIMQHKQLLLEDLVRDEAARAEVRLANATSRANKKGFLGLSVGSVTVVGFLVLVAFILAAIVLKHPAP